MYSLNNIHQIMTIQENDLLATSRQWPWPDFCGEKVLNY